MGISNSAVIIALPFVRVPKDEREGWDEHDDLALSHPKPAPIEPLYPAEPLFMTASKLFERSLRIQCVPERKRAATKVRLLGAR